jgi:pSer/pThr/pTyr-binding forkhead associated (FHA) protein
MRVLNGEDAGRLFRLRKDSIRIGRTDPKAENEYDPQHDIALSNKYGAVSRVWRPHARLIRQGDEWLIEHCEGTNGTYLDNRRLERHEKQRLGDHNVVDLAVGEGGARLVFLAPEPNGASEERK